MDLRISVPMTFMRSPGLRQFFYRKKKLIFFGPFFSNSRSIISATDLRISVPMTFMRSPGLRQFFYRKKKIIFLGPFLFKFAVHYLRNGPEDFGSDDIYEVPRPQTIFVYIYKKIFLGPFFSNSAIMDMIRAPLSKQTSCTSTRDCSINIEPTNFKLSRHKAKNIIQVQDRLYYEIPHSS